MKFDSKIVQQLILIRTLCSDRRGRRRTAARKIYGILLSVVISGGFFSARCEATVFHSDGSEASVQACIRSAADGDIVTLPAGIFTWTYRLEITKGITLKGQTTITGAGTSNPTINDGTIIRDNTPRSGAYTGIIHAMMTPTKSFRLTGITFARGDSTRIAIGNGFVHFSSQGTTPNRSMRMDHCHFASLYQGKLFWVSGWVYGVADRNVIEGFGSTEPFYVTHGSWGGSGQVLGNGSWADYPWYGTEKFFFVEDNTLIREDSGYFSGIDCNNGGRWVMRHNYLRNYIPSGHGTEGGRARGQRANEFYNNTVHMTVGWNGGQRSGTSLWHDNTLTGVEPANNRQTSLRPNPIWGIADGTSPWDQNDTEGNGTYVEGHPPYLFASGSATSGTVISGLEARFSDSAKNWTPDQWRGYSIRNTNPASASYGLGSFIISNNARSITYAYNDAASGGHLRFNTGDTYKIYRVLVMTDQNGRGKGDQVVGNPPINTVTGTPFWTHQALEPCYSWNNVHLPSNRAYGYGVRRGQPTTKLNIDFFNLGSDFPRNTTPQAVSNRYTAARNGVNYVGTYTYPHPLVSE
jgi:hypothetical protein